MQARDGNPLAGTPLHLIIEPELAGPVGNPPGAALISHHVAPAAAAVLGPVGVHQECVTPGPRDQDDAAGLGGGCQRAPGVAAGDHVGGQTGMPECCFLGKGSKICFRKEKIMVPVPYLYITASSVGADPDPSDPYDFGPLGSGSVSQVCGSGSDPYIIKQK
jgi:hypothetical protein